MSHCLSLLPCLTALSHIPSQVLSSADLLCTLWGGERFECWKSTDTGRLQMLGRLQSKRGYLEKWQRAERGKRKIPSATYLQDRNPPKIFNQSKSFKIIEKKRKTGKDRALNSSSQKKKKKRKTLLCNFKYYEICWYHYL